MATIRRIWGALLLSTLVMPAWAQKVEYIHTDALGSIVAITDENANVIERREYEPYGRQLSPAAEDGPGYTGHVQDAATGLLYMQQRYYDPGIGRPLSVDPVTADPNTGSNFCRYCYANNNPYRFVDPDGRQSREFNFENQRDEIKPPPRSEKDWLGPALGVALGVISAPALAAGGWELGMAALANPATANAIGIGAAETVAGVSIAGQARNQVAKAATARVGELVATHGRTMSNNQLGKLANSIKQEGIKTPLTVTRNEGTLYLLDGHNRAAAAARAGVSEVPIREVDLPFGAYKTPDDLTFTPGGY